MKKRIVFLRTGLLLTAVALAQPFGCEDDFKINANGLDETVIVSSDGGVVSLLAGNIVLTVPPGALSDEVRFSADILFNKDSPDGEAEKMEDMKKSGETSILRTVMISPSVVFNKPVQIRISYDGCLKCPQNTICQGMSLYINVWEDENCFLNQEPSCCSACSLDPETKTMTACMMRTGVIAVTGEMNQ